MNLRIITKNHADDSKIASPLKIDFKAEWTHESMPTAWELKALCFYSILPHKEESIAKMEIACYNFL